MDLQGAVLAQRMEMTDNPAMSHPISAASEADAELAKLIERSQRGDQAAMEALYGRYKTALFNLAYRYSYDRATAEDLLQEIFIKVFTHIGSVNRTETFTAWVYRIALNTCYSHLRSRKSDFRDAVPLDVVEPFIHSGRNEEAGGDLRKHLEDAIALLPPGLREVFLLHDVQGFKHHEIGRMLRLSIGTSKSQLFKARLRLREILKARSGN
jgi:RNA polymerase sigma-70 factor (ECF subfamily)